MALGNSGIDKFNNIDSFLGANEQEEDYQYEGGVYEKNGEEEQDYHEEAPVSEVVPDKTTNKKDEVYKHHMAAKYSDAQIEWFEKIKLAIATDNDSKALRWVLDRVCEDHGEEIDKISKKRRRIGTL